VVRPLCGRPTIFHSFLGCAATCFFGDRLGIAADIMMFLCSSRGDYDLDGIGRATETCLFPAEMLPCAGTRGHVALAFHAPLDTAGLALHPFITQRASFVARKDRCFVFTPRSGPPSCGVLHLRR